MLQYQKEVSLPQLYPENDNSIKIKTMFSPKLSQNNYFVESKKTLPLTIKAFFCLLCFILGIDFGFSKGFPKKWQNLINSICLMMTLIVALVLIVPLDKKEHVDFYWYIICLIEYVLIFIIIKVTKYTAYDFFVDLNNIDGKINVKVNETRIGVILWAYFFVWYFLSVFIVLYDCEVYFPGTCTMSYIPYQMYTVLSNGVDFMFVVPILMYCYLYYYLIEVNTLLKTELNITITKKRYVAIVETNDKIRPFYEKLILLELLEIPKMMGLIYSMLKYMQDGEDLFTSIGEYVFACNVISNMICTGAIGQLVKGQGHALKFQLHSMLLEEKDVTKSEDINRLLGYIEARQLWRPVAGVIPVDMRLATTAFSLFATYMIVLVQLTHVVD